MMLFLYALLFFLLGTSVVAIPVSPAAPHVSPRGIGFSKAVDESPVDRINGCWKSINLKRGFYMRIENGAIVEFWPPLPAENKRNLLYSDVVWSRAKQNPFRIVNRPPSHMTEPESHQFPEDQLLSDRLGNINHQLGLEIKLKPQGKKDWGERKHILLRIDPALSG
ncbi:hypothetical protein F5887DRAFT_1003345 [Amanita rubescens]|nr:hypothetical protein F5887DRAFT_1003345 [Amanita rubescens]